MHYTDFTCFPDYRGGHRIVIAAGRLYTGPANSRRARFRGRRRLSPIRRLCGLRPPIPNMSDYAKIRINMVDSQLRPNKVNDPALIDAFLAVPREAFVPEAL